MIVEPASQNDVLRDFTERLERLGIENMLTGSMALVHYAVPRLTADIDIVLDISETDADRFIKEFELDYYLPQSRIRDAISRNKMFNILDQRTIIKIDCVVRKRDKFQDMAFSRRRRVNYSGDFEVWIISKEDLILSKLNWAKSSHSETQMRDVASMLRNPYDENYVKMWSEPLGVNDLLKESFRLLDEDHAERYDT
jgi:hypothetical protein